MDFVSPFFAFQYITSTSTVCADTLDTRIGSREQNYRPEDCAVCHSMLVGKKGTGFWEGGKGAFELVLLLEGLDLPLYSVTRGMEPPCY